MLYVKNDMVMFTFKSKQIWLKKLVLAHSLKHNVKRKISF